MVLKTLGDLTQASLSDATSLFSFPSFIALEW